MSEIICRNCGAQNPAQSKFCNKCGETLASGTSQLCPNCQAQNPLDLLYCDNCGTRLADDLDSAAEDQDDDASAGAQPFSLPSRPPGSTGDLDVSGEIPSWLKTGEMEDAAGGEEEIQDWLSDFDFDPSEDEADALSLAELGGEHEPSDDLPPWLLEDDSADEIFYSEKSTDELFSDPSPAAQEDSDSLEEETPDWLQGLNAPDTGPLPSTEDELAAPEAGAAEWPIADESDDDSDLISAELEDWLKEMEEEQQAAPPEDEDEIPEEDFLTWLATLDEGGSQEEEAVESADDLFGADDAASLEFDFDPDTTGMDDVGADEAGTDAGDEASTQAAEDEGAIEETPAWLDELTEVMDEQVEAEATPPDDLPEWLQALSPEVDEQAAPVTSALDEPEIEEPLFADFSDELSNSEEDDDQLELPGWLADVADVAAGPDFGAEDALVDEFAPALESDLADEPAPAGEVAADAFDFLTVNDDEDEVGELVASDDLPDWFSDVLADMDEGEEAFDLDNTRESDAVAEERPGVPQQLAGGLPEWLDHPFTDLPEAEPTPLDEIPEWLLPMAPSETEMAEEPEGILNLGEAEIGIEDSEWSDLLEALPPPERDSQTLSEAEIPEWLQALKPRSLREAGVLDDEEVPLPEESEGPLAGLRGVLAISPVVSRPIAAERNDPEPAIAEQQQQVTLLRQLAREESQETITRAAPEGAPSYSAATRIVLALLLLAAVLTGLLFPGMVTGMVPNLEPMTSSGLAAAQSLLDEAAGQPVIVAFDYTPALNGILQPQANAVLEALAANDSQAILLSQTAAGATLAEQAATGVDSLQSATIGYLPGNSVALRQLSSCLEPGAACQSISGRPLAEATAESLQNAALLIVLTGDLENLQGWIEQVESQTELPMMAVVTPAVAPLAAPYHETGQLSALVSTLPTPEAGATPGQTEALALAHWLAAVLLLLGALFTLLRGVQQSRQ